MRILHCLSQTELTGAEVYAQNLIQSQVEQGHSVFVISDRIHVPLPVPWKTLPLSSSHFWQQRQNRRALRKFLMENDIQVIHCHSRGAVRHAHGARRGLPIAMVSTIHGKQHFSWSKKFFNIYGEILIAICENAKKSLQESFGLPESSLKVLRNPVSDSLSAEGSTKPPTALHIALLGRSSGPKGERFEQVALSCFENWLSLKSQVQISLIAPRPERFSKACQDLFIDLQKKFPGRFHLQGEIPDLRQQLRRFDLVLASGRIAIESLLEKVPVFAIGEDSAPGFITPENLGKIRASNFGDIGEDSKPQALDLPWIQKSIQDWILKPAPTNLEKLRELTLEEFGEKQIQHQVLEIYKAAIFKRHHRRWIPALMYHKIPDQELSSRHRIFVSQENFEKHLQFLKAKKFTSLTFADLKAYWEGEKPWSTFPHKPLILTFDDGYRDNLVNAEPLLKKYGFKATIYLLGDHQITENTWDANTGEAPDQLMSLAEKKKLDPQVWEIGSHGFSHAHLTQVREELAWQDLRQSKEQLQKDLGVEVLSFAYPFGSRNDKLAQMAAKAGYSFAVNTDQGGLHLADDPYGIFRVNIFPEDGLWQLWKKTSSWYRRSFYRKRGR